MSGIIGTSRSRSGFLGRSQDTASVLAQFDCSTNVSAPIKAGSINVSTVGYENTGRWIVNFRTVFNGDDYIAHITCSDAGGRNTTFYSEGTFAAGSCQINLTNMSQTGTTSDVVCFSAFGR